MRSLRSLTPLVVLAASAALAETPYQKPPAAVLDVLHAPLPPNAFLNPTHDVMILASPVRYPPIADLAKPMLRLAGVRVEPKTHGPHNPLIWSDYTLVRIRDGAQTRVAMPAGAKLSFPFWSADGKRFAFAVYAADAVELWLGDGATGKVRRVPGVKLNPLLEDDLRWMPDQKALLVKTVPKGQPPPPEAGAPMGPDIQEASGERGPSSTYEVRDVLKSPRDEALFEYYATSQLALVDATSGKLTPLGKPGLYTDLAPSPSGQYFRVLSIHRPFSYLTAWERFPTEVEIWDAHGALVKKVASIPLQDSVPIWGVPTGPREITWRATEPATLVWAEALDGGDWKTQVPHRDRVMQLRAPFDQLPGQIYQTEQRFTGFHWSVQNGKALAGEHDAIKHWTRTFAVDVDDPQAKPKLVWDHSTDEHYKHPGTPVMRMLPNGFHVLEQDGDAIFLSGAGGSPDGDRPFLDRLDLKTLKTERLFRSEKTRYEAFAAWIDPASKQFLTRRESQTEAPNFFARTLDKPVPGAAAGEATWESTLREVTHWTDPTPQLRGITKKLVKYKRADGVDLSFTLYLPPGYKEGTRLPAVVWAYPLDYADPNMAGQVAGSTQRFTLLGWPLQLFFLLDGYAVIDNPSLPVVGDTNKIYDTYMEQLVAGARAAVDKAVDLGVVDRDRIGITGHSHGGLMTVNLLEHSDLFRAGIARSGAYNRSLTAFGFQNERRTLWEATDVYVKVSPFFHVNELKLPLLLVHGEQDVNPGTVPLQSELLYEAIRGNGGTVRLVMLPHESHGYSGMESLEHLLYESLTWFDKYVKNAPPRARPTSAKAGPP